MIRLAYLAPEVLEALVAQRRPPAISINEMVEVAKLPWEEQMVRVFNWRGLNSFSPFRPVRMVPLSPPLFRHKGQYKYCY